MSFRMPLWNYRQQIWILLLISFVTVLVYVFIANSKDLSLNRSNSKHSTIENGDSRDSIVIAYMQNITRLGGGNASGNTKPDYKGSSRICKSRSGQIDCPSNNYFFNNKKCIKISLVGLCGSWTATLGKFPGMFSCPGVANTTFVVEHADKPAFIKSSDIVIFTFVSFYMSMDVWLDLMYYRSSGQMWVFQTEESPYYATGLLPPWMYRKYTYDISNTYRSDADIFSPYGYYLPFRSEESNQVKNITEILEKKSRFMVWISSHCETLHWDRTKLVNDLQKKVEIDIFGKCGNDSLCKSRFREDCTKKRDDLISSYKFNLALENSCCEDYLTEKLWHTYSVGSVPVVMGPRKSNYEKFAPPRSFIHLDDFDSISSLQSYLEYLDKNDTAYLEYFEWREEGIVKEHSIKEHFQNHLSNSNMCLIAEHYLKRKELKKRRSSENHIRMFDPYGPEWKGSCHSCGNSPWVRKYEYGIGHKRKNTWKWAK